MNVGSKEGVYSVLLEEFEDVAGVIEPTDRQIIDKGEVCETIILSFNGEILKRLIESEEVLSRRLFEKHKRTASMVYLWPRT